MHLNAVLVTLMVSHDNYTAKQKKLLLNNVRRKNGSSNFLGSYLSV